MKNISDKKQQLLEEFKQSPIKIGETIEVKDHKFRDVVDIKDDIIYYKEYNSIVSINIKDIISRLEKGKIGTNPFKDDLYRKLRVCEYSLESILHNLGFLIYDKPNEYFIHEVKISKGNFNPFIFKDGKKFFYQRELCWSLEQKQLLVESIYNGINCGIVIVRRRDWKQLEEFYKQGERELSFHDVVDGKQRINSIYEFINGEFPDMYGNYFGDLSSNAQHKIMNTQLIRYAEMDEGTSDQDVIRQFLSVNFTGVPQSMEHINYVKSLLENHT